MATAPSTPTGTPPAPLRWSSCSESGLNAADDCSSLTVPLDYSAPAGSALTLALIRRRASGPSATRIGSLLINPGGPGGSTVDEFDSLTDELSPALRQRFDVVGFDPRGVGHSTPSIACANGAEADRLDADYVDPTTAAGQERLIADAKEQVASCLSASGPALLAHVGTRDAARDIDTIRAALGDQKTTYLGYSYGTFLGATYAAEFPDRVRALVLDGAVDPGLDDVAGTEVQAAGFENSLQAFLADCQSRGSRCGWHPGGDLLAAYRALLAGITTQPLPTRSKGRVLTLPLAQNGVAAALYSKDSWSYLEQGLAAAAQGDGTTLLALSDFLTERDASGHYSNLDAALGAVNCIDDFQPPGLAPVLASYRRLQSSAPDFAAFALSEYGCAIWPFRPTAAVPLVVNGAPPVIVVGATGDPATPLSEARGLAAKLPGSRLLIRDGQGHTSYSASTCVRAAADAYLLDPSVLPANGLVCPSS